MLLDRFDGADPEAVGRLLAAGRLALGTAALLAPRALVRPVLRQWRGAAGQEAPSQEAVTALRMTAGRDIALGLGALLASRRSPQAMRGWLEAGALADAIDAAALAGDRGLRLSARLAGAALAAGAAAAGGRTARRLIS